MQNKNLGKIATDKVTGFSGTVVGYCQYLTGCDQYLVTPKCEEGKGSKYPDGTWLDVNRLELSDDVVVMLDTEIDKGPDKPAPQY